MALETAPPGAPRGASGRQRAPLSVLLLADDFRGHANTILDQLAAFRRYSEHKLRLYNPRGVAKSRMLDLDEFDVVVIHFSLVITSEHYLAPDFLEKLSRFQGLKIQLIQDDYRWVDAIAAMMRRLGIHVLFTLVPRAEIPKIWDDARLPGVEKISYLAGYVPENLLGRPVLAFEQRPLEIGYRGRVLPYWIGRIGQEKAWIAQGILARADRYRLRLDVGWREGDRIYGRSWVDFIASCKATLGTESGASITDFDGSIERAVKAYLADHPQADFEDVHRAVLAPHEGNVRMNVISPRLFEAAALRAGLILFPGDYSGVLRPGEHYLQLAKDFSNLDEVVEALRDPEGMKAMISRTYDEVALSGRYSLRGFIRDFDEVIWRRGSAHGRPLKLRYAASLLERHWHPERLWQKSGMPWLLHHSSRAWLATRFTLANPALLLVVLRASLDPRLLLRWAPALVSDLIRYGLLCEARTRGARAGPQFNVSVVVRPDGQLTFVSRPLDAWGRGERGEAQTPLAADSVEAVAAEVVGGRLTSLAWNHSLVSGFIAYPWTRSHRASVGMNDDGIWRFSALEALARRFPRRMALALQPALAPRSVESSLTFRIALAMRLIARHPPLARLLAAGIWIRVRHPASRRSLPAVALVRDLLRLMVLLEAHAGHVTKLEPFRVLTDWDPASGRLRLSGRAVEASGNSARDVPNPLGQALGSDALAAIEWDGRGLGPSISYPWSPTADLRVDFGAVYPFAALGELARHRPIETWQALMPLLGSLSQANAELER